MKRILTALILAALPIIPSLASADEKAGVYVTPKFVYGFTVMNDMQDEQSPGTVDAFVKGSRNDHAFGGALAIGYDFDKKFQIPVRTELEYSMFSEVSGKKSEMDASDFPDIYRDTVKQTLHIQTLFVNVYYDFHNSTSFTPYIGGGLGLAFIRAKGNWDWINTTAPPLIRGVDYNSHSAGAKNATNFAWNVGAGVAYAITDTISVDLGYRFSGLGGAKSEWKWHDGGGAGFRVKTKDIYMHQVLFGLRFTF
jgi:opacity protein-like surface antigen